MKIKNNLKINMGYFFSKISIKLSVLILFILVCIGMIYYFRFINGTHVVFTHFFYIPIAMAGCFWGRKSIWVAAFLGICLIVPYALLSLPVDLLIDDFLRGTMFIVIAWVIGSLRKYSHYKDYAEKLEHEISKTRKKILETNQRLYKDIEHARIIQHSMLPPRKLQFIGVEFFSALLPCENLSGDFFNIFEIDKDNIGMYLVDVSGHGISPSIMTIFTDRTIVSNKLISFKQQFLLSPSKMLDDLFMLYNDTKFPPEMYFLMFYGVYNNKTREFTYSSAGLNTEPLMVSGSTVKILETEAAFPICKMGQYYKPEFKEKKITLKPGDKLLLYSDGLVEATNREGAAFTNDRLLQILKNNSSVSVEEMFYGIFDRLTCFVLDEKLEDDVTFFLMHVT